MAKLKDLLSEVFEETQKVDRHKVSEGVRNFGIVGKSLYNNSNIMEIAEQLSNIAEQAHHHILGENDDWFDKISVNKNMKNLKGNVVEFQKTAKEAHMLNQRLTGLYEDIGHVLNRYYEIDEALDAVGKEDGDVDNDGDEDSSDDYLKKRRDAVSKSMKNEDKGDMDNDGKDEPDSDEYMDNKDKAIKKAMKKEGASRQSVESDPDKQAGDNPEVPDGEGRETQNEDKGDMDNDGKDEPDSEEYMDNKDKAIKKAMGEIYQNLKNKPTKRLKDIGNVTSGIPSLGQFVSKFKK